LQSGERLHPGARSLCHHVLGNVLRKRKDCEGALEQLRVADTAAWDGGRGERDYTSLEMIPDIVSSLAARQPNRSEAQRIA
jgi:hypothetical protein